MMNRVVTVITFIDKLKYARQSELQVQAELEHIERLHRIMRLPNRSAVYAAELAEKLAALERRLNNSKKTRYISENRSRKSTEKKAMLCSEKKSEKSSEKKARLS